MKTVARPALRVYIAGPISKGDIFANIRAGIDAGEKVLQAGHCPFVPHMNVFWGLVYPHPHAVWYEWDNNWLRMCDALIRLPGESPGADAEVALAHTIGLPVCTLEEFLEDYSRV